MLQLIEPIWMISLAGIAVPVIIHLWNIKTGKTLKVGSIALLKERSRQNARSLRLSELLLLALRCLFIVLMALLLSKPLWRQPASKNKTRGWVLIEPGQTTMVYARYKLLIDSLLQAGFEYRRFSEDFKKEDLQAVLKSTADPGSTSTGLYWPLLRLLEQKIPAGFPVHLFTSNSLVHFSGQRPGLALNVNWHTYTPADSLFTTIASAYLTPADSIKVLQLHSSPSGTSYATRSLSAIQQRDTAYNFHIENGRLLIADNSPGETGNTDSRREVVVDTATLRLTIYTDYFLTDAGYLKAALDAIQQYTSRKILVSVVRNIRSIPSGQQWLFWLSEAPVPGGLQAGNIFYYQSGKMVQQAGSLVNQSVNPGDEQVSLYKMVRADSTRHLSVNRWQDGFGNPVLANFIKDKTSYYPFFSRFDPEWNELVWSEKFPALLIQLVLEEDDQDNKMPADKRMIDTAQLLISAAGEKPATGSVNAVNYADPSLFIWVLALVVFVAERIISFNKKKEIHG